MGLKSPAVNFPVRTASISTGVRQKLTSKMIIDATKPPRSDPERRNFYERLTPIGLEDLDGILNYGKESKGNNSLLRFSDQIQS